MDGGSEEAWKSSKLSGIRFFSTPWQFNDRICLGRNGRKLLMFPGLLNQEGGGRAGSNLVECDYINEEIHPERFSSGIYHKGGERARCSHHRSPGREDGEFQGLRASGWIRKRRGDWLH
ncbi:hypothetical protein NPIL_106531 [Nephila pilipes]|uniref:Uncharacterized protein n=1 Tax=Nephila pilipes TaxID=299642 RepID=A0A8X6N687_NEPPI|nr:hypothetical protein NPIL_106531 [Nephila pilipes]